VPPSREKILNLPGSVFALVVVLVAIHAVREAVSVQLDFRILTHFSFVPGRFTLSFDPDRVSAVYNALAKTDATRTDIANLFLGDGEPLWWTPLTYAFLHANWLHVGLNCLWFVAFGAPVARRFGLVRFYLFCAGGALAGALAHYATHSADLEPVIGASATVAGVMAAAVRFVFQPGAPLGQSLGFGNREDAYRQPALPLRGVLGDRRTVTFLIVWFGANFLFGAVVTPFGGEPVAWEAHVGGFLFGLLAFHWFDPPLPVVPPTLEAPPEPQHWT